MQCPRCLNTDRSYFYKGSKGWYCRRCISFGRMMLEEETEPVSLPAATEGSEEYVLQYPLTASQKEVSRQCAEAAETTDVLINAACGAGKTELVLEVIAKTLAQGKSVCFAIPRRQVVLELSERLRKYFPNAKVTAVCGGHTSETEGDLIVATTHQLFRYYAAFDLLILDEPDAYPFRGSPVLHGIAKTACRGRVVYLTATPDETMRKRIEDGTLKELKLNRRPHGHPVPEPRIITAPAAVLILVLIHWLKERASPRMVFVPTIREAHSLYRFLKLFFPCRMVTSKSSRRDEIIEAFRSEHAGILVSTTVMERGVTIPGVDICVFHADHGVFDEASLIQMAGRAGRTFQNPDGDVLFLQMSRSRLTDRCRRTIQEANQCAA